MLKIKQSILVVLFASACVQAKLSLPSFFSDGMVLQQQSDAPVWGTATPGAEVSIKFGSIESSTIADESGEWRIQLRGLVASKESQTVQIQSGSEQIEINDVLVGEVWLASGQSNMEWQMQKTDSKDYAVTLNNPLIRQYVVPSNKAEAEPQKNLKGKWQSAVNGDTSNFSAVGYHFAEELFNTLDVPVAVIELAWGGKPIEAFISDEKIRQLDSAAPLIARKQQLIDNFDKTQDGYLKQKAAYDQALALWKKDRSNPKPKRLRQPVNPASSEVLHSTIFNGMIAPFIGYGTKGVIWYQGERNTAGESHAYYAQLSQTLIEDWRERWSSDLAFYYVQLANYIPNINPGQQLRWVELQDQQRKTLDITEHTGMAVITDIGNPRNIHPTNKKDVGFRLSQWAKTFDYQIPNLEVSGPLFHQADFKGNQVIINFSYAEGLKSSNAQALATFEVSGDNEEWHPAVAEIENEAIIVTSSEVSDIQKVRYAWHCNPTEANLTNKSGFPASCFKASK